MPIRSPLSNFTPGLVVFDKDGTLIDFHAMWGGWTRQLADQLEAASGLAVAGPLFRLFGYDAPGGRTRADALISYTPMATLREMAGQALLQAGCEAEKVEAALAVAWHVPDPVSLAVPLADLPALFDTLRARDVKVAVATGDDRGSTLATLEHLGVAHLVDAIACGDDGLRTKPAPDMLFSLCQQLSVAPYRTAMVGDTAADLQMGRAAAAGLVVGVLSGANDGETLAPYADYLIPSIAHLLFTH
jgi:phosphoglycolate phosphatase-like HAD superfamily hydrolase